MNALAPLQYILERYRQQNLEQTFRDGAGEKLGELRKRRWPQISARVALPAHTVAQPRGAGYALMFWPAKDLVLEVTDAQNFMNSAFKKVADAARELGRELGQHLRGEGKEREYGDALLQEACTNGVAIAVNGIRRAEPGDELVYMAALPHLAGDDGRFVHRPAVADGALAVVRFFAAVRTPDKCLHGGTLVTTCKDCGQVISETTSDNPHRLF